MLVDVKLVLLEIIFIGTIFGREGYGPTDQEWGYVEVKPDAHMFWWLHRAPSSDRPLIIWLQGGPGMSSTGYGNFAEIGPLDMDLNPRNSTWTADFNVLFVDNPVGSGFSYTKSDKQLAKTNREIAEDFLAFLREFYGTLPEFKNVSTFMLGESYGGKMVVEIALCIDQGEIDQNGYEQVQGEIAELLDSSEWYEQLLVEHNIDALVMNLTDGIDVYNVLTKVREINNGMTRGAVKLDEDHEKLDRLMNGVVKEALGLNSNWSAADDQVDYALYADNLKPVTHIVEQLLNETNIKIAVYNGQLDYIVNTPGTLKWVDGLKFVNASDWKTARRNSFAVNGFVEGYVKKTENLAFYWVNRAGHSVPTDNPEAMKFILDDLTKGCLEQE